MVAELSGRMWVGCSLGLQMPNLGQTRRLPPPMGTTAFTETSRSWSDNDCPNEGCNWAGCWTAGSGRKQCESSIQNDGILFAEARKQVAPNPRSKQVTRRHLILCSPASQTVFG